MKKQQTLFLAWQDPFSRDCFVIGRLTFDGERYQFVYTKGVEEARSKRNFNPLASFPSYKTYTSTHLFPVFANRLMSRSRPDYLSFIERLNLSDREYDPIEILARSGGERQTDTLAVFPLPEVDEQGRYNLYFSAHGLQHLPSSAIARIEQLELQHKLWLAHEFQNSYDPQALTLNTEDHHIVGYCPRYLNAEILEARRHNSHLEVRVERVNQRPTPLQRRLLCKLSVRCREDFRPFSSPQYQPFATELVGV